MTNVSVEDFYGQKKPAPTDSIGVSAEQFYQSPGTGDSVGQVDVVGPVAHYQQDVAEGLAHMRQPGIFNKARGAIEYLASPLSAASESIGGDPLRALFASAPPKVREFAGRTGEAIVDVLSPGAVEKGVKALPEMAKAFPEVAREAGGIVRSGVNAIDDIISQAAKRRVVAQEAKAANAAPTKEKLYSEAGSAFEQAKKVGGELPENYLRTKIVGDGTPENPSLREKLASADINLSDHPELFKQASDMMRVIDRKIENGTITSFADLMKLQRELRPYVRRAKAEGLREGDDSGLRAATILRNEVGKLLDDFPDASGVLKNAKGLYRRAAKMDDIDDIISKARRTNDPSYLQTEFRNLALDDYAYKNFTPAEQKIIDQIARTSRLENAADAIHVRGAAGAARRVAGAVRGVEDSRMKLAEKLRDMVARGEEAQNVPPGPSVFDRINTLLRPGPPNSANR